MKNTTKIYIPIWLDLLSIDKKIKAGKEKYLHSNMVRFIISWENIDYEPIDTFTFQYG